MITSRIMVLTYDLLEDGHKDDVSTNNVFLFFIKYYKWIPCCCESVQ